MFQHALLACTIVSISFAADDRTMIAVDLEDFRSIVNRFLSKELADNITKLMSEVSSLPKTHESKTRVGKMESDSEDKPIKTENSQHTINPNKRFKTVNNSNFVMEQYNFDKNSSGPVYVRDEIDKVLQEFKYKDSIDDKTTSIYDDTTLPNDNGNIYSQKEVKLINPVHIARGPTLERDQSETEQKIDYTETKLGEWRYNHGLLNKPLEIKNIKTENFDQDDINYEEAKKYEPPIVQDVQYIYETPGQHAKHESGISNNVKDGNTLIRLNIKNSNKVNVYDTQVDNGESIDKYGSNTKLKDSPIKKLQIEPVELTEGYTNLSPDIINTTINDRQIVRESCLGHNNSIYPDNIPLKQDDEIVTHKNIGSYLEPSQLNVNHLLNDPPEIKQELREKDPFKEYHLRPKKENPRIQPHKQLIEANVIDKHKVDYVEVNNNEGIKHNFNKINQETREKDPLREYPSGPKMKKLRIQPQKHLIDENDMYDKYKLDSSVETENKRGVPHNLYAESKEKQIRVRKIHKEYANNNQNLGSTSNNEELILKHKERYFNLKGVQENQEKNQSKDSSSYNTDYSGKENSDAFKHSTEVEDDSADHDKFKKEKVAGKEQPLKNIEKNDGLSRGYEKEKSYETSEFVSKETLVKKIHNPGEVKDGEDIDVKYNLTLTRTKIKNKKPRKPTKEYDIHKDNVMSSESTNNNELKTPQSSGNHNKKDLRLKENIHHHLKLRKEIGKNKTNGSLSLSSEKKTNYKKSTKRSSEKHHKNVLRSNEETFHKIKPKKQTGQSYPYKNEENSKFEKSAMGFDNKVTDKINKIPSHKGHGKYDLASNEETAANSKPQITYEESNTKSGLGSGSKKNARLPSQEHAKYDSRSNEETTTKRKPQKQYDQNYMFQESALGSSNEINTKHHSKHDLASNEENTTKRKPQKPYEKDDMFKKTTQSPENKRKTTRPSKDHGIYDEIDEETTTKRKPQKPIKANSKYEEITISSENKKNKNNHHYETHDNKNLRINDEKSTRLKNKNKKQRFEDFDTKTPYDHYKYDTREEHTVVKKKHKKSKMDDVTEKPPAEGYADDPRPDYKEVKPESIKAKTEKLIDDDSIENKGKPTRKFTMKGTMVPKRDYYKLSSPNYYKDLPRYVDKYDFQEPIPEKDRVRDKVDNLRREPARINKRIKLTYYANR